MVAMEIQNNIKDISKTYVSNNLLTHKLKIVLFENSAQGSSTLAPSCPSTVIQDFQRTVATNFSASTTPFILLESHYIISIIVF